MLHKQVHHRTEKNRYDKELEVILEKRKAEPRTTNENTKELIAITVDLQKVYWLGYLMVGSKVLHKKVYYNIDKRIEDKELVSYLKI